MFKIILILLLFMNIIVSLWGGFWKENIVNFIRLMYVWGNGWVSVCMN